MAVTLLLHSLCLVISQAYDLCVQLRKTLKTPSGQTFHHGTPIVVTTQFRSGAYLSAAGSRRHCCLAPEGVSGPHCWAWVSRILSLGAWPAHSPWRGLSVGAGTVGTQTSRGTRRRARHRRAESRPTRLQSSVGHLE